MLIRSVSQLFIYVYKIGKACRLWDEYEQPVYNLTAVNSGTEFNDSKTVSFGMREFTLKERSLQITAGLPSCAVNTMPVYFLLPTIRQWIVAGWERVFNIARSYGINHYRFHSYCPP
jgi:hypothetical protein